MRPRHKAAENIKAYVNHRRDHDASMRPRHKAAENALARRKTMSELAGLQ